MSDRVQLPLDTAGDLPQRVEDVAKGAFGVENRARLLSQYFAENDKVTPENAWLHAYRLLLWVDRRIGLAHCYESDKCQPGRPWYLRSLRFHDWVTSQLSIRPDKLQQHVDWLFSQAITSLSAASAAMMSDQLSKAALQRQPFEGRFFPEPGEDPELVDIVVNTLGDALSAPLSASVRRQLSERVTAHLANENKRKNLLGEGFEDTLAEILRRIPEVAGTHEVLVRKWLDEIPGFRPARKTTKRRQVDLALVRRDGHRILITAKWSVRSDREEQFRADFADYADLESHGEDFEYVLVTNEFDAARLVRACDNRAQNSPLFSRVIHLNPEGPSAAYGSDVRGAAPEMHKRIASGRLISLQSWLSQLADAKIS
ncbi:hypothetical protein GCM10010211_00030 [Streptomyces albospinus]|uniref:Restriction endonuclease type IV Mrr domain-containing protein n=1 Tax=Streptomyces albospinus TaxID=285515 RepID=A0ABQ2UJW9_9ACTN|nr:hypothetical protein [Streptomyces albospinus]GGU41074.1 hypothetical protein GCM10010211_00030 [Streptomyces albospinus]